MKLIAGHEIDNLRAGGGRLITVTYQFTVCLRLNELAGKNLRIGPQSLYMELESEGQPLCYHCAFIVRVFDFGGSAPRARALSVQ